MRLAGAAALLVAISAACGTSSSRSAAGSECGDAPTDCPAGTTCWPADAVPNLECLPSQGGVAFGAPCQQQIGRPTCADTMACDQQGPAGGVCTWYCNAAGHGCPPGYDCRITHVGGDAGPGVAVCRASESGDDGGPADGALGDDYVAPYVDVFIPVPDAESDAPPNRM